jgi:DNA-binding NtrC family response regulator
MQAKLLRVLEDFTLRRVGATTERKVDVRVVSATNRNLEDAVRTREFRQDLLFRLNAGILRIPPLRERRSEIAPLANLFLARAAAARNMSAPKISAAALTVLEEHDWPGNIRELRNVMDRALALANGASVAPKHLPETLDRGNASPLSLAPPRAAISLPPPHVDAGAGAGTGTGAGSEAGGGMRDSVASYERERIEQALAQSEGNQTRAALLLGIPRRTLAYRMNRLGIRSRS